jgi:hypothetical protein
VIAKFTASLESPCIWDTYIFEGVAPGIRRVTPDDMPRGTVSRGGEDRGCLPQLASLRGDNMNTGHVASVLEHKDNVDILCSNLSIIDPVFTCVLVSLFPLTKFNAKTRPCKMYVL